MSQGVRRYKPCLKPARLNCIRIHTTRNSHIHRAAPTTRWQRNSATDVAAETGARVY